MTRRTNVDREAPTRRTFVKVVAVGGIALGLGGVTTAQDEPQRIELVGTAGGWEGVAPGAIAGETNPTLQLTEGQEYEVVWENGDGQPHDFVIESEAGDRIVDTDLMDEEGATQSVGFTADVDLVEYFCSVHPGTMVGAIEVDVTEEEEEEPEAEPEEVEEEDEPEEEEPEEEEEEDEEVETDVLREFEAVLTGEAHGVETDASGHTTFEVEDDETSARYTVAVERICDVTQAHIHLGAEGEEGPVVVWLYPEEGMAPELREGLVTGVLAEGTITEDDLVGEWEGADFADVVATFEEGGAYVNVHTEAHPGGEIRGQIEPVG